MSSAVYSSPLGPFSPIAGQSRGAERGTGPFLPLTHLAGPYWRARLVFCGITRSSLSHSLSVLLPLWVVWSFGRGEEWEYEVSESVSLNEAEDRRRFDALTGLWVLARRLSRIPPLLLIARRSVEVAAV